MVAGFGVGLAFLQLGNIGLDGDSYRTHENVRTDGHDGILDSRCEIEGAISTLQIADPHAERRQLDFGVPAGDGRVVDDEVGLRARPNDAFASLQTKGPGPALRIESPENDAERRRDGTAVDRSRLLLTARGTMGHVAG